MFSTGLLIFLLCMAYVTFSKKPGPESTLDHAIVWLSAGSIALMLYAVITWLWTHAP